MSRSKRAEITTPAARPNAPGHATALPTWDAFVIRQEAVVYGESPPFRFTDPVWYVGQPGDLESNTPRLSLARIGRWVGPEGRRWLADLWLKRASKLGVLRRGVEALYTLSDGLPDYIGTAAALTRAEARRVEAHLKAEYDAGRLSPHTIVNRRKSGNRFVRWARTHVTLAETGDFRLKHPAGVPTRPEIEKPLGQNEEKFVEMDVLEALLKACAEDERDYEWALARHAALGTLWNPGEVAVPEAAGVAEASGHVLRPPAGPHLGIATYQSRAILAQVIKLAVCVGRRAISLCQLPAGVRAEEGSKNGLAGVWVRFHETKITGLPEDAFCYDVYADIAVDAIARARRYTDALRAERPGGADRLFLLPAIGGRSGPAVLRPQYLNTYLVGRERTPGLIKRRQVKDGDSLAYITSHNFRTTYASKLFAGGTAAHDVGAILGHSPRSLDMAVKHYAVGNAAMRAQFEREMQAGALEGDVIELAAGRPVAVDRISPTAVAIFNGRGIVYIPTAYGYCVLPAEEGPCPTSHPCWLGPDPDHPKCQEGCGCPWEVRSPAGIPALEEDAAILAAQREALASDPRFANFVSHNDVQYDRVMLHLARARRLKARLDATGRAELQEVGDA